MTNTPRLIILQFLRSQKLAVIATSGDGDGTPESALIAFTEDDDLCLYFQTGKHTRKAMNLRRNPRVSLVTGLTTQDMATLQYEGLARQITDQQELQVCKQMFAEKDSPTTAEYFDRPESIFFKVIPTWIGYSDYRTDKPKVLEITDFL